MLAGGAIPLAPAVPTSTWIVYREHRTALAACKAVHSHRDGRSYAAYSHSQVQHLKAKARIKYNGWLKKKRFNDVLYKVRPAHPGLVFDRGGGRRIATTSELISWRGCQESRHHKCADLVVWCCRLWLPRGRLQRQWFSNRISSLLKQLVILH